MIQRVIKNSAQLAHRVSSSGNNSYSMAKINTEKYMNTYTCSIHKCSSSAVHFTKNNILSTCKEGIYTKNLKRQSNVPSCTSPFQLLPQNKKSSAHCVESLTNQSHHISQHMTSAHKIQPSLCDTKQYRDTCHSHEYML